MRPYLLRRRLDANFIGNNAALIHACQRLDADKQEQKRQKAYIEFAAVSPEPNAADKRSHEYKAKKNRRDDEQADDPFAQENPSESKPEQSTQQRVQRTVAGAEIQWTPDPRGHKPD